MKRMTLALMITSTTMGILAQHTIAFHNRTGIPGNPTTGFPLRVRLVDSEGDEHAETLLPHKTGLEQGETFVQFKLERPSRLWGEKKMRPLEIESITITSRGQATRRVLDVDAQKIAAFNEKLKAGQNVLVAIKWENNTYKLDYQ